jgi:hypothetical protein
MLESTTKSGVVCREMLSIVFSVDALAIGRKEVKSNIHILGVTGYDIDCYRADLGKVVGALYEIVYTSKTIMCVVPLRKEIVP